MGAVKQEQQQPQAYWALQSIDDEESQAMGVEIRKHSVKGAVVDVVTGEFRLPGSSTALEGELCAEAVGAAVQKVVEGMAWEGPVGCSITKAVARGLGVDPEAVASFSEMDQQVGAILQEALPGLTVVTMIHTEAAGYSHLCFGDHEAEGDLVMVCTIGKALGGVLYNKGHRVRNTGMNRSIASHYERDLAALQAEFQDSWGDLDSPTAFLPPFPDEDETIPVWEAWVDLIDRYLIQMCDYVKPDTVVLMPTGAASMATVVDTLIPNLTVSEACETRPRVIGKMKAAGTIVKGAAAGALIELKTKNSLAALQKGFGDEIVSLQALTHSQLRTAFDAFDLNGNGVMSKAELLDGITAMGLALSQERIEALIEDMHPEIPNNITFPEFSSWWKKRISESPVTFITHESEWDDIVEDPFPQGQSQGALVILEIGFTFCRPCKAFENKYERFAKKYPRVRFVRVNGNENSSTVSLCRDRLGVKKTPSFYLFRDGEEIHKWTGANPETFEENLLAHHAPEEQGAET